MSAYRVELRAAPETPEEEERARKQGRVLGPQTVVYPLIVADKPEDALRLAVEKEASFLYRQRIWTVGRPVLVSQYGLNSYKETVVPTMALIWERNKERA